MRYKYRFQLVSTAKKKTPSPQKPPNTPSLKLLHILRLHMPDQLILIRHRKIQRRVPQNNTDIEFRLTALLLGDGALEALLQPELAAIGAVVDGAEGVDGCVVHEGERGYQSVQSAWLGAGLRDGGRGKGGHLTFCFPRGRLGFFVVVEVEGELPASAVAEAHFDGVVAGGI